jgi:hypothetical protein
MSCVGARVVPKAANLKAWRPNAKVRTAQSVENRATARAEATHIYDPDFGPVRGPVIAYRTLFAQWNLVFRVAAANRASGARPMGAREFV